MGWCRECVGGCRCRGVHRNGDAFFLQVATRKMEDDAVNTKLCKCQLIRDEK